MDSYRASKAWHIGQELAHEVHALIEGFPADGSNLRGALRMSSMTITYQIAASVKKQLQREKVQCYHEARAAAVELQAHLSLARDVRYIEMTVYKELASKAIATEQLLTVLIRKGSLYGTQHN